MKRADESTKCVATARRPRVDRGRRRFPGRRGAAAVLAMLFLTIFVTLSLAMYTSATLNVQSAHNLSDVDRARASAESGLRWMQYRFLRMNRPRTTIGNIDAAVADGLWPALTTSIQADFNTMLTPSERTLAVSGKTITSNPVAVDDSGARFRLRIQQHPLHLGDPLDARYVRVTSTGTYRGATRSVSMDFLIDKKVKFAVVGKVPIQIGRNTIVEGPIAMATASKFPPILQLTDFRGLDTQLTARLDAWANLLELHHEGYDNRVKRDPGEDLNENGLLDPGEDANGNNDLDMPSDYRNALVNGFTDANGDGYLDDYDVFLDFFDVNGDAAISQAEFTNPSTGTSYDANLFSAIDQLGGPMFVGDPIRDGYNDGVVDNRDSYAKVEGQVVIAATAAAWTSNLASSGKTINDMVQGPIVPTDPSQPPVKFGANGNDIFDLSPVNFEDCANGFRARSGSSAGASVTTATVIANRTLSASLANASAVTERTPLGSVSYQATYRRPVFRNLTLRNVIIPKGLNALFDNCVFEGVTFVEGERDVTTSSGSVTTSQTEGMNWAKRRVSGDSTFSNTKVLISGGTASSGQMITRGSRDGNNLRFNNCTFRGPIAGNYSTAYTHFANSWEFTGATLFDNQVDETATIVSPQVNIEMGSFTDPAQAPSTLKGVVVAGNIDIRGTSIVDGSIIVTGDGAGNTTLGYFGPSDSDTNPSAMPEGGYGKLIIKYNPHRALPDGINVPIDVLPDVTTYREGM